MSITQGAEFGESIHSKSCSKIIPNHIYSVIKTPLLLHIKYSQTNTEAILIVLSFYCPLKKERKINRWRKVPLELLSHSL